MDIASTQGRNELSEAGDVPVAAGERPDDMQVVVTDASGQVVTATAAWLRFVSSCRKAGVHGAPGEMPTSLADLYTGMTWQSPQGAAELRDALRQVLEGTATDISRSVEVVDDQGQAHALNIHLCARAESGTGAIILQTERPRERGAYGEAMETNLAEKLKTTHRQLLQSEKLASIGQLAAGVAHEINNPIGYINSNLNTLHQYIQDLLRLVAAYRAAEPGIEDQECLEHLAAIRKQIDLDFMGDDIMALLNESQEGIECVMKIVQAMKDFSRTDDSEWARADLHEGLDSTLSIVYNELKYKADIIKEYDELPLVECVLSQLNQVFMNLLVNAAQAIEEHGTVTIRTGKGEEGWVWVEIADTGSGIPEENLQRLFEPFFTTKPVGKGTGIGLSLSYGIVQAHGGKIGVASKPGEGTVFRVELPVERETDTSGVAGSKR
jgi:signal transduction histidine kinase